MWKVEQFVWWPIESKARPSSVDPLSKARARRCGRVRMLRRTLVTEMIREKTYALFALERLASFATSTQFERGKSVCLRTSRIYCSVVSDLETSAILTIALERGLLV